MPASENNAKSNLASTGVVYPTEKNNGGLKPPSPTVFLYAGESDKREGKDELPGGDNGWDDAAGDNDGMAESNSKLMRTSSDSDTQDDVKDDPKPAATSGGSSNNNSKGKGKCAAAEMNHKVYIWTERERTAFAPPTTSS